jgi:hypothetical protein
VITELREYLVREGAMDEFVQVFNEQVVPLRRRFGFIVEGAWRDDKASRFVWVVSHPAPEGWEAALAPYLETRATEVDPDPGSFLTEVKTSFVADAGSG